LDRPLEHRLLGPAPRCVGGIPRELDAAFASSPRRAERGAERTGPQRRVAVGENGLSPLVTQHDRRIGDRRRGARQPPQLLPPQRPQPGEALLRRGAVRRGGACAARERGRLRRGRSRGRAGRTRGRSGGGHARTGSGCCGWGEHGEECSSEGPGAAHTRIMQEEGRLDWDMPVVRGLLFDLWNTLVSSNGPNPISDLARRLRRAGVTDWLDAIERGMMRRPLPGIEAALPEIARAAGISWSAGELAEAAADWRALAGHSSPFPDTLPVLDRLSGRYRLGLLSNTQSFDLGVVRSSGLVQKFHTMQYSWQTGLLKPDPRAYA